ncbi:hypothetical protein [Streptomyces sp. NBC_00443]|uniref:hypothetical protein n=1 Tax=Streptomyces sp. NBC_00443 TaxID=2975743 RepID=UPI002E1ED453
MVANAFELMRGYGGFDLAAAQEMMIRVFYLGAGHRDPHRQRRQARARPSVAPEGGGGDYGSDSGGYDRLGFGTLMYAK